jgi:hypothetical protein
MNICFPFPTGSIWVAGAYEFGLQPLKFLLTS